MKLGDWLAQHEMRQWQLAKLVGARQQAVANWVNGNRTPTAEFILAIRRATNGKVDLEDWVSENPR
jgi:DNA-binding transcriptional regulator YdaS (Cro superfamily)